MSSRVFRRQTRGVVVSLAGRREQRGKGDGALDDCARAAETGVGRGRVERGTTLRQAEKRRLE